MKTTLIRRLAALLSATLCATVGRGVGAEDIASFNPFRETPYSAREHANELRFAQLEPTQPFDLSRPSFATESSQPFDVSFGGDSRTRFGSPFVAEQTLDPLFTTLPAVEQLRASEQALLPITDAGSLLTESNSIQTVEAQRRSPVAFDPHVRGYTAGQVFTTGDGAYWTPVRQDLDSMLGKIDPALIREVNVIPGPYGVAYGPGFSFIDVVKNDTPRYFNGAETHHRFGFNYLTNGQQMYGRETVSGGSSNYGFIVSYGNRNGSDYQVGGAAPISRVPASYLNQNFLGQVGFDLNENSSVEVRYNRLDQSHTEYAVQFFDVNFLVTDGFSLAYQFQHPEWERRSRIDLWYNRTRFAGDTQRANKRSTAFPVISRVESALQAATGFAGSMRADTNGDVLSTGGRGYTLWGEDGARQLRLGADVRFLEQQLVEQFSFTGFAPVGNLAGFSTNMPRSQMIDPGAFAELTLPMEFWTTKLGGRVDWVNSTAFAHEVRVGSSLPQPLALDQSDLLYAAYLTNDVDLTYSTTLHFGGGHAQRPPTLMERYADGIFLGMIQNGFSRVIGNPGLQKERNWQVDVGLDVEFDRWRGKANYFHAWIDDYITWQANVISDPSGARLLQAINTNYATLNGVTLSGEYDVSDMLVAFGSLSYVEGTDRGLNAPLAQIAPLDSRVGLRLSETVDDIGWGAELGARIVDQQNRFALFRAVGLGGGPIAVEQATPGFATFYLRGFYNVNERLNLVGGIDNLFDRTYIEHLNLRLPDQGAFRNTIAYSPGITPYVGLEWTR